MTSIQTIHASDLRGSFADALKSIKKTKRPLVVKHRNIPTAVLVDIDEYEDYLNGIDPLFVVSIRKARAEIRKGAVFTMNDVFGGIEA